MDPAGMAGLQGPGPLHRAEGDGLAGGVGHVGHQLVLSGVRHEREGGHFFLIRGMSGLVGHALKITGEGVLENPLCLSVS